MSDYGADPLLDAGSRAIVDLDSLPLASATKQHLRAWAARWER
jgi:hypothetical protein